MIILYITLGITHYLLCLHTWFLLLYILLVECDLKYVLCYLLSVRRITHYLLCLHTWFYYTTYCGWMWFKVCFMLPPQCKTYYSLSTLSTYLVLLLYILLVECDLKYVLCYLLSVRRITHYLLCLHTWFYYSTYCWLNVI